MNTKDIPEDPRIPPAYRKSGLRKIKTVGQLIEHLQMLPADLKMNTGFGKSLDVYVSRHLGKRQSFQCCISEND